MEQSESAWACGVCQDPNGRKGGQYHGPWGHSVRVRGPEGTAVHEGADICYDCWQAHWWARAEEEGGEWAYIVAMLAGDPPRLGRR